MKVVLIILFIGIVIEIIRRIVIIAEANSKLNEIWNSRHQINSKFHELMVNSGLVSKAEYANKWITMNINDVELRVNNLKSLPSYQTDRSKISELDKVMMEMHKIDKWIRMQTSAESVQIDRIHKASLGWMKVERFDSQKW